MTSPRASCRARPRQRKRCTSLLIIFIKDTLSDRVRRAVVPARIIGVRINTHSHNDTGADIRAAPSARTGQKRASNEKITVFHGRTFQFGEGWHSNENTVRFWTPSPRVPKEADTRCYAYTTAYATMTPLCNVCCAGSSLPTVEKGEQFPRVI